MLFGGDADVLDDLLVKLRDVTARFYFPCNQMLIASRTGQGVKAREGNADVPILMTAMPIMTTIMTTMPIMTTIRITIPIMTTIMTTMPIMTTIMTRLPIMTTTTISYQH